MADLYGVQIILLLAGTIVMSHCQDYQTYFLNPNEINQKVPSELGMNIDVELPPCCTNLTIDYTCQKDGEVDTMKEVTELEPFTDYSCTGHIKDNNVTKINTTALRFRIDCDLNIMATIQSTTNTSTELSWKTTSQKCGKVLSDLKKLSYACSCAPSSSTHKHSVPANKDPSKGTCKIDGLEPYTKYDCEVQPKYNNKTVPGKAKVELETTAGIPEDIGNLTVTFPDHNVIKVTCMYGKSSKGPKKIFIALLHNNGFTKELENKTCDFEFKDLSYLTEYKLEVTVFNGEFQSNPQKHSVSTYYNDQALAGCLVVLIVLIIITSSVVLYKIYARRRRNVNRDVELEPAIYVNVPQRCR